MDESLKQKIAGLRDTRVKAAIAARTLALRELDARELKLRVEERLRAGVKNEDGTWHVAPIVKTDAEKFAKVDAEYLAHERQTAQLAYEQAVTFAAAESQRFEIEALLVALEVAGRDVAVA